MCWLHANAYFQINTWSDFFSPTKFTQAFFQSLSDVVDLASRFIVSTKCSRLLVIFVAGLAREEDEVLRFWMSFLWDGEKLLNVDLLTDKERPRTSGIQFKGYWKAITKTKKCPSLRPPDEDEAQSVPTINKIVKASNYFTYERTPDAGSTPSEAAHCKDIATQEAKGVGQAISELKRRFRDVWLWGKKLRIREVI